MNVKREILKKLFLYLLRNFLQGAAIGVVAIVLTDLIFEVPLFSQPAIISIIFVGLGNIVTGFLNFKAYATPFAEIESFISTIAQGDLTRNIDLKKLGPLNRFGAPMNLMRQSLNQLVSTAKETAEQVNRSIETVSVQLESTTNDYNQITHTVREISTAIQTQSQSAAESSRAVDDIAVGVGKISESSITVGTSSTNAASVAASTREDIESMNHQMKLVQSAFGQLATTIQEFVQISEHISGSIQAITDISGQTNLLALNASIEAARAGEQGKGFAVVASEVRKLANKSSESANAVQELIIQIKTNTKQAMDAMVHSEHVVDSSFQVVTTTETSMLEILNAVETINQQIHHISFIGEQLAAGGEEVSATVDEMAKAAESSNKGVLEVVHLTDNVQVSMNEITQETSKLHELGNNLQTLMNRFTI
ncbi:MAG: chemotaxis protein [Paenibacillus sp.]|nr:chemotaxis protein [Paenibacillus sp.]